MNRGEILTRFRQENPEITSNVASDSVLQSWVEVGNLEICRRVRLIRSDTTFTAVIGTSSYNLSNEISNFYDIDEYPGGGVSYDDNRLTKRTISELDSIRPSWRTASNGTPKDYYRRGSNIVLGTPPDTASDIQVYTVLIADPLDADSKTPYNELSYLEPYHYALVLYLKMRAFMGKVKKRDAAEMAMQEYENYIVQMEREINRGIYTNMQIRPPTNYRGTGRSRI